MLERSRALLTTALEIHERQQEGGGAPKSAFSATGGSGENMDGRRGVHSSLRSAHPARRRAGRRNNARPMVVSKIALPSLPLPTSPPTGVHALEVGEEADALDGMLLILVPEARVPGSPAVHDRDVQDGELQYNRQVQYSCGTSTFPPLSSAPHH